MMDGFFLRCFVQPGTDSDSGRSAVNIHTAHRESTATSYLYTKRSIHGRSVKWHMDCSTAAERGGGGYNYLVLVG